jgi:hypothetical protein
MIKIQNFNVSVLLKVSVTFSKEHNLRACKKGMLRRMFGPMRGDVNNGWRKMQSLIMTFIIVLP